MKQSLQLGWLAGGCRELVGFCLLHFLQSLETDYERFAFFPWAMFLSHPGKKLDTKFFFFFLLVLHCQVSYLGILEGREMGR